MTRLACRDARDGCGGRYEATNLRPRTYRVQVVTTNFKKFERTGVLVGAAGGALGERHARARRPQRGRPPVAGESRNNITLESQAIVRGLDEQQLDLPRNSRDIQSFLLLNPNVVGGADDIQFLGAKTYGVSCTSRTDRRRPTPSSAPSATRRLALTPSPRLRCSRTPTAPSTEAWRALW